MSLGLVTALLLLQTAYQLDDHSLKLTAARDRASDLFVTRLHRLQHSSASVSSTDKGDSAFVVVQASEVIGSPNNVTVSYSESKWNNWLLAGVTAAGVMLGFSLSLTSVKMPSPSLPFDTERFAHTFKQARVIRQQGTCRLLMARHGLDGQQYLVQERLLSSAEKLQASVKQSCEGADVLRYITCWIEQGPAHSILLFSQFAISH